MINSVSQNLAYTAGNDMIKARGSQKSENIESKSEIKTNLSEKAASIAQKIANGSYEIDLKSTAKALASELFND